MKSKKYPILINNKISFKNYFIIPLRKSDIQKIRIWRNDQINILRQTTTLIPQDQLNYYNKFIKKSFQENKPNIILFSFLFLQNQFTTFANAAECEDFGKKVDEKYNPIPTRKDAEEIEAMIGKSLRERGFGVWFN